LRRIYYFSYSIAPFITTKIQDNRVRKLLFISCVLLLTGCSTAPYFQTPAPTLNAEQALNYKLFENPHIKTESHVQVHLDEAKDITYVQNFGGGGVALGVALGPIGVLANVGMIQAETDGDVEKLYGKLPLPVADMFGEAAINQAVSYDETADVRFHPFVMVVRDEDEMLRMGTALIVEIPQPDGTVWNGRYTHQTSLHLPIDDIADGLSDAEHAQIHGAIEQSFDDIVALYVNDRTGKYTELEHVLIESTFLSPRIVFEINAKVLERSDDRVTLRSGAGLISLPLDGSLELKSATANKRKKKAKS
jgi:hypothetical protein